MNIIFAILSLLLTLVSVPVAAQTYPTMTTLSANATATATVVTLASGTGVAAGGALYIDAEYMDIVGCANTACTNVTVNRVQKPNAHSASAVVFVVSRAAKPSIMLTTNGAFRVGQCSTSTSSTPSTALAAYSYLPIIDIDYAWVYSCRRNGPGGSWVWNRTNVQTMNGTAGSVPTSWP